MWQPLPTELLGRAERHPARLDELVIGFLESLGRRYRSVVMARAALLIARQVEREQHLGDEASAFFQHRVDRIRRRIFEPGEIGVAIETDHAVENETRVADGGIILGHDCSLFARQCASVSAAWTVFTKRLSSSTWASMSARCRLSRSIRARHFSMVT